MSEEKNCGTRTEEQEEAGSQEARQSLTSYLKQLLSEKQKLEEKADLDLQLAHKLLVNELERIQSGHRNSNEERRFADIIKEKPIKVTIRVLVPVKEHPKFNFVGKLLGPKGNSLKRLQEDTMTKMAILGRGSMRDKHKEEELRSSADPKYAHFNDDLHVEITAFAPPAEAHARIAYALAEVRKFLVPDYNDEIRQEQMREMQLLNTAVMGMTPTAGQSSPTAPSTTSSPPPTSTVKTNSTTTTTQNGRHVQTMQQNGRNYLYNQQFLLHPAFRGLNARAPGLQLSAMPSVFHAGAGGSILNRLRPHHLATTPGINATANNRVSPGAVMSAAKHQRNNILSILAGGPRSVIGAEAAGGNEQLLASMCSGGEEVMVPTGEEDARASSMYGLYENYAAVAAVAAAASTQGYGLIENYTNGNGVIAPEAMEEIAVTQETSGDLTGARSETGAVKMDRARYRHDPYSRYTPVKLQPL